ncbi:subclass B3 metallo-beta-lactamase [Dyella solisilvae]|uniref:Subclass B3 metallo-beta-lactamase n=1 Tax=Dyella solisilvae TaxID=1920168 RepID=A0A370KC75_9GAMM|nr:subclass B3 metallo-beta-lactamase [Dyella solisilvae]RDJ00266.1 subclass B3 metallo-beta-lactamase [Dyella solisilvae]
MKLFARSMFCACLALSAFGAARASDPEWTQPQKPFRVYGNTYYVGTHGLTAVLIASSQGLVLIDGTLPQNAAQIEGNIKALGFRLTDVKRILNTHAHSDHAGAIAALAHDTGATVMASAAGAKAIMLGGKDPEDPQFDQSSGFPSVAHVMTVADGGVVQVGDVAITAHYTPGHTPGSTSWAWQSCEAGRCVHMVYADSLGAFAADGFRFTDDAAHPHRVEDYQHSIDVIAALPCDILITPHPSQSRFLERVAGRDAGAKPNPLIDSGACRVYAEEGRAGLAARLAKEQAAASGRAAK